MEALARVFAFSRGMVGDALKNPATAARICIGMVAKQTFAKDLRREIKAHIHPVLAAEGFEDITQQSAWRTGDGYIDVFSIERIDSWGYDPADFAVTVATYYTDQHRLPWAGPCPPRPAVKRCGEMLQIAGFRTGYPRQRVVFDTKKGLAIADTVLDARDGLVDRGLPWLEANHDLSAYVERGLAALFEEPLDDSEEFDHEIPVGERAYILWPETMAQGRSYMESLPPKDHLASLGYPMGDALYGLLIRFQRWDDLLKLAREAASEAFYEQRWAELESEVGKRHAAPTIRSDKRILARFRNELAQIEELVRQANRNTSS